MIKLREKGKLDHLSDSLYLSLLYWARMGKKLNVKNPVTFNEKLQWMKLNDRKDIYSTLVDKQLAKEYVSSIIGHEHIIPTLGIWNHFEDIDFGELPNQFVLKCTHDSGGLVICKDKSQLDLELARKKINKSLSINYYLKGREWPYKNVKPKIIAEEYMEDHNGRGGLRDYKFYCFNGEPKYLYVSEGLDNHSTARISFLTLDWQFAPFGRSDYQPFDKLPDQPPKYGEMLEYAKILSEGFIFLRVDLYEINNQVYFSELTLHPCSGMMPFEPEEWDKKLGDLITIPKRMIKNEHIN